MESENEKKPEVDESFLNSLKPEDYKDELIKFKAVNTNLNQQINESSDVIKNLRTQIAEKENALREISRSFDIEKSVNERMKNIIEHSSSQVKKELTDDQNYDKAIEALVNYNKEEEKK